jgi:hypothetical protein
LRFRDLGKFRGRRKTFERRSEHGMRIGWPAVRLIKLGQGKRCAQFKTPCFLLLGEGDCGEQCILGRRRIRRIALEQNLAAQAIQESVAPVFFCLTGKG